MGILNLDIHAGLIYCVASYIAETLVVSIRPFVSGCCRTRSERLSCAWLQPGAYLLRASRPGPDVEISKQADSSRSVPADLLRTGRTGSRSIASCAGRLYVACL